MVDFMDLGSTLAATVWDQVTTAISEWWHSLSTEMQLSIIMAMFCMAFLIWFIKKVVGFLFKWIIISALIGGAIYGSLWYTHTMGAWTIIFPSWDVITWWYQAILIIATGFLIALVILIISWAFRSTSYLRAKVPAHFNNEQACKKRGGQWMPQFKKCAL
jgi:hypothetical protein